MAEHLTWLNETFLRSVLNSLPDEVIEITKSEAEPAVPVGENYFSIILRVKVYFKRNVDYEEESMTFISKSMPDGVISEFLRVTKTKEKELSMYRSIIPKIESLTGLPIAPQNYCCDHDDTVIMEDLKLKGYKMVDRIKQLDYEHCVKALKSLATFHAGSVVLHDTNPDLFKIVSEETVYPNSEAQKMFANNAFRLLSEEVEHWSAVADFAPRLLKVGTNIIEEIGEAIKPSLSAMNVLNHGDFWGNNLLYYYDGDSNISDVRLIDWQFCRWTTPAMDLQLFFYSSVRDLKNICRLTKIYLSALNEALSKLGSQQFLSDKQLEKDLRRTDCYGLLVAVSILPICIGKRGEHLDFSETTLDDFSTGFIKSNPYAHIYKGLKYKEVIPKILDMFRKKNVL